MIHVKRKKKPEDFKLYTEKSADGRTAPDRERDEATAFYNDPANLAKPKKGEKKKTFTFKIYKNSEIADELKNMFGGKCAYCEAIINVASFEDIEHFRPKSEVHEGKDKLPGYFWLAGEWENLLLSCQRCNRPGSEDESAEKPKKKTGKGNLFPLRKNTKRAVYNGSLADEEPGRLLLNPCIDDPEKHLAYDDEARIKALVDSSGVASDMGETSIEVYSLYRMVLTHARTEALKRLEACIVSLGDWIKELDKAKRRGESGTDYEEKIIREKNAIADMLKTDKEFLGMLRFRIRENTKQGKFDEFLNVGIDLENLI